VGKMRGKQVREMNEVLKRSVGLAFAARAVHSSLSGAGVRACE